MKKVLVTGGTGIIGTTLVKHLIKKGYSVKILSRKGFCSGSVFFGPNSGSGSMGSISCIDEDNQKKYNPEIIKGDIRDPNVVKQAVKDVNIVFHLAAVIDHHSLPSLHSLFRLSLLPFLSFLSRNDCVKGEHLYDLYREINVKGTELLMKEACKAGVDRVVFFSSISVYGKNRKGGGSLSADENTVLHPDSMYAVSKAAAEKYVLAGINHRKEPIGVVLRPASVYGPGGKKNYTRLIKMIQHGFFITVGKGRAKRTIIHDYDLAGAALVAAVHPKAKGNVYNVTDGCVHSLNDIRNAIAGALRKKYINICLSEKWVGFILFFWEKIMRGGVIASGLENMVSDTAVNSDKIQEELGFRPEIQLDEGWENAVKRAGVFAE